MEPILGVLRNKRVLRLGLLVCWRHFLFFTWFALGDLDSSGSALLSRSVGLDERLVGAESSQGAGSAAAVVGPTTVSSPSPAPPSLSSELPSTLGPCLLLALPTRWLGFLFSWVDALVCWLAGMPLTLLVSNLYSVGISWYGPGKDQSANCRLALEVLSSQYMKVHTG